MATTSSSKSSRALKQKESSSVAIEKPKNESTNAALLGFDLLFQLAHMSAVAAAGVTREKIMSMAASVDTTTAHYFKDIQRISESMNYPFAESCRIVGERAEHQDVRGFLLRFSSALNTGESESDFLASEAAIQAEAYGNIYERALETLKKWTDAFTALIVSASLIIVVATVSTMIFDLGITFVAGLVLAMMGISGIGVWVIYLSVPREIRTLRGDPGLRTQGRIKKTFTMVAPIGLAMAAIATLVHVNFGVVMLAFGALLLPVGFMARGLDKRVKAYDQDIATFLRVLGTTVSSIGTTPVVALGRIDMRSMPTLVQGVKDLQTRLTARINPVAAWQRFVDETGSEVVSRSVKVFLDGTGLGGDAEEVGRRASLLGVKVNQLRMKRALVSDSFTYLSLAMHAVIGFLLIFIVEVVNGFNGLISTAGIDVPGGPGAALGSVLAFNSANLAFLRNAMLPVLIVLGVVNAMAPKIADGGYAYTIFYYLGLTTILGGLTLLIAPILANVIFGATAIIE